MNAGNNNNNNSHLKKWEKKDMKTSAVKTEKLIEAKKSLLIPC